ncbi:phage tail tape measure protein [Paenibacillus macerans]|uniref:phage tail tape measure protein n=1 Tax=Paenibacillus macerans TaxID=44252 RepID=UPI00204126F8|nr:tail tape measure protein [Paenibacillus macerans]MCM3699189.1 tail tape measure protein [Paenibacillus macerans]
MSDSKVRLRADDEISPLIDNISGKIAALAATAGGIVIGGGIADTMFGGVMDYSREAARSAAFLPDAVRQDSLNMADTLYKQDIISDPMEGVRQLADAAPLVQDKSQMTDFMSSSAKIQKIRPDAGAEEVQRALSQASNSFKESYSQVADSMMYAYKEVGDKQQDLFDTFWEYSPYFSSSGTSSAQMSNFLTQTVKEGAFNFDKPADFFKETFGVKALNTGDMANYFVSRGAGTDQAQKQAQAFTADINSGDKQRAQGAITALIADLASQSRDELKQSLVTLGSGAGEDNADSILKTYGVAFQKAPDMTGTTDRLVQAQQAADPMTSIRQTRAEIDLQLRDIGINLTTAALPALKEFNDLLVENKDEIQAFGAGVTNAVTTAVGFYKDHMTAINTALMGLAAVLVAKGIVKGIVSFGKSVRQLNDNLTSAAKWIGAKGSAAGKGIKSGWNWIRGKQPGPPAPPGEETPAQRAQRIRERMGGRGIRRDWGRRGSNPNGGGLGGLRSASMTINASIVYLNGRVAGGAGGNGGSRRRGGVRRRGGLGGGGRGPGGGGGGGAPLGSRENPWRFRRPTPPTPPPEPPVPPRGGWLSKVGGTLGKGAKYLKPVAKAAGIAGTIATVGMGAYDLYQASKQGGLKEGLATSGGSMVGSTAGGIAGGAIGSLLGPVGTAVGAAAGSWVGEKLGRMADESGLTRKVVEGASNLFTSAKDNFVTMGKNISETFQNGKANVTAFAGKAANVAMSILPPDAQTQVKQFAKDLGEKGIVGAVKGAFDGPIGQKVTALKNDVAGLFTGAGAGNLKKDLLDLGSSFGLTDTHIKKFKNGMSTALKVSGVGTAIQGFKSIGSAVGEAGKQADVLGGLATGATKEIVLGAVSAGKQLLGIGGSSKQAAEETRQHLTNLKNIAGQGASWGSNLIDMMVSGIRSKFTSLTSAVTDAAGIIGDFLGFHSPTERGPASDSDTWAGNFVSMFAGGLQPDPIRRRMNLIAGTMRQGVQGIEGPNALSSSGSIPVAQSLNMAPAKMPGAVTIGNINFDFGELAKGITDFTQFAQMLTGPEGRALVGRVVGEELVKAMELGG